MNYYSKISKNNPPLKGVRGMTAKFKYLFLFISISSFFSTATAQSIEWLPMKEAQELALENNKKVLIYAKASWCGYCKRMQEEVFPQESVSDSLHKYFYPVRIDIESGEKLAFNGQKYTEQGLSRKFRVFSTPTFIFLKPDGSTIGRQPGFMPADVFDRLLAYVGADLFNEISFKDYLEKHKAD